MSTIQINVSIITDITVLRIVIMYQIQITQIAAKLFVQSCSQGIYYNLDFISEITKHF